MKTACKVAVLEGAKADFLKRHRKDTSRADDAWKALVALGGALAKDSTLGDAIQRERWPKAFKGLPNLYRLELPHAFRAIYTVIFIPGTGHLARIEWLGDHKEYDRLFGYSTS